MPQGRFHRPSLTISLSIEDRTCGLNLLTFVEPPANKTAEPTCPLLCGGSRVTVLTRLVPLLGGRLFLALVLGKRIWIEKYCGQPAKYCSDDSWTIIVFQPDFAKPLCHVNTDRQRRRKSCDRSAKPGCIALQPIEEPEEITTEKRGSNHRKQSRDFKHTHRSLAKGLLRHVWLEPTQKPQPNNQRHKPADGSQPRGRFQCFYWRSKRSCDSFPEHRHFRD